MPRNPMVAKTNYTYLRSTLLIFLKIENTAIVTENIEAKITENSEEEVVDDTVIDKKPLLITTTKLLFDTRSNSQFSFAQKIDDSI